MPPARPNRPPTPDQTPFHGEAALFLDRDAGLIELQRRILEHALDAASPLLERLRLLGLSSSMVNGPRLARGSAGGVLTHMERIPGRRPDTTRWELASLGRDSRRCLNNSLIPALAGAGVHLLAHADLDAGARAVVAQVFHSSILPRLEPLAFADALPFLQAGHSGATLAVTLLDARGIERFAAFHVPDTVPPLVSLQRRRRDGSRRPVIETRVVWLDEVIAANLAAAFPGLEITAAHPFRVLQAAGIEPQTSHGAALPDTAEQVGRWPNRTVMLVVDEQMPAGLTDLLAGKLPVVLETVQQVGLRDLSRLVEASRVCVEVRELLGDWRESRADGSGAQPLIAGAGDPMQPGPAGARAVHVERGETLACVGMPSGLRALEPALEPVSAASAGAPLSAGTLADQEKAKEKKKKKARAAWISFAGRIVAQIVGAVATIVLGVYAVNRYSEPRFAPEEKPDVSQSPSAAVRRAPAATGDMTLVVLPLDDFSADAAREHFADGLTEALIAELAQRPRLRVISRTSAMHYKGQRKTVPEIAQELGADLIVEGSVTKVGDRVRITAQLIDGQRDEHLWARSYDHRVRDALVLQTEVAAAIAGEVTSVVAATQDQRRTGPDVSDPPLHIR